MTTMREIPLHLLVPNPDNPRKVAASETDEAGLVASIQAHGLLQPLLVQEQTAAGLACMVIDGHRRLKALHTIHGETDVLVPCQVRPYTSLISETELATAANMVRADMHPIDECDAIASLIREDAVADIEAIAARFGQPALWVKQRLKLAGLSKRARDMFRNNDFGINVAMCLTLGSEEQQDRYLKGVKPGDYRLRADTIRGVFTEKKIPADRAWFDLKLYPQDQIQRDLFSEEVWLLDRAAFDKLQGAAFDEAVEDVKKEGWGEVLSFRNAHVVPYETSSKYVVVDGKIKKADRSKMTAFVIMSGGGAIKVERGWVLKKQAKKVKKNGAHAVDSAKVEDVKPVSPADLTAKQRDQLQDMMGVAVAEQCAAHDTVALWTLISPLLNVGAHWSGVSTMSRNGPKRVPGSTFDLSAAEKTLGEIKVPESLAEFEALPAKERMRLVRLAAIQAVEPCDPQLVLHEWDLEDWFRPDAEFVNGWRLDQLIAYEKRIGAPTLMKHHTVKKADHVSNILATLKDGDVSAIPPLPHHFGELAPQEPPPEDPDEEEDEDIEDKEDEADEPADGSEDPFVDPPETGDGKPLSVTAKPAE